MFCKKSQLFKEFIFIVEMLNFSAANCSNSSSVKEKGKVWVGK